MGYLLIRNGWNEVVNDRTARGVFILDIVIGGQRCIFSTADISLREYPDGPIINCISAIVNDVEFGLTVDPYNPMLNPIQIDFTIMRKYFPIEPARNAGLSFVQLDAKLYWAVISSFELDLLQAFLLVDGTISSFQYDEESDLIKMTLVDKQRAGDRCFPPAVTSSIGFSDLATDAEESLGKCFPVVVGSVKKLPVIDISSDFSKYIAMDHSNYSTSGTPVTAVYNGVEGDQAITHAISAQGMGVDSLGHRYWYVQIVGDEADSYDVTVDIDGIDENIIQAIIYLLTTYSDKRDMFDLSSLRHLDNVFSAVTIATAFNEIVEGGVVQAIRERFIRQLPIAILQRAEKFYFQSLLWDRDVQKFLSTEKNILQTVSPPTEVGRDALCNDFVLTCGVSGFRGDTVEAIQKNADNDGMCQLSKHRYGSIGQRKIDLPDIADAMGGAWVLNWYVETFSKMRVSISYLCSFDVIDLNLWDTVRVYDTNLGWEHGPFFKIVGIKYGISNGIILNLISVDDYFDVWGVYSKWRRSL